MPQDFSTKLTRVGDETVIHVRGEIDMATAGHLRDAIEPHLGPAQTIVLDLSEVRFMDSSCIHVLLHARGALSADGGSLLLRNPSQAARRVLTLAQAEGFLEIEAHERADAEQLPPPEQ